MYTKPPKFLIFALYAVLVAATAWLFLHFLLPWLLPFLLAFALAAVTEPAVHLLQKHGWPRALASGLCALILWGGSAVALLTLISRAASELPGLTAGLPSLLDDAVNLISSLEDKATRIIRAYPGESEKYLSMAVDSFKTQLTAIPRMLSAKLLDIMSAAAGKAPAILLFAVTAGVGGYFISASYPEITSFIRRQLPPRLSNRTGEISSDLKFAIGRWMKAQLLLTLITFSELLIAFTLLRLDYAAVLALVVSVIDALPVFGAGTVLLPCAAVSMLTGDVPLGVGLAVTYVIVMLLRNCIQAKLIGDQLGLPPVVTLFAIYIGFKTLGVLGMVLFPILAVAVKQLNDRGIVHLWKKANPSRPPESV